MQNNTHTQSQITNLRQAQIQMIRKIENQTNDNLTEKIATKPIIKQTSDKEAPTKRRQYTTCQTYYLLIIT